MTGDEMAERGTDRWIVAELRSQLEEALGIISDLADLHDSYIGYLDAHHNYNEEAARAISERIQVLKLKQ